MMRTTSLLILTLSVLAGLSAQAQTESSSSLTTLTGYQPTTLASEADALQIYNSLPTDIFKGRSGCFQRAHHWSYNLNRTRGIKSMKVFLFFTARYQREFDYEWAYHVAPLIPVTLADGSVQEMVFDPTFTSRPSWVTADNEARYDSKPIPVSEWIKYFIFPEVECPLVENYQDYYNFQERYYCYTMKAPMYNYIPENFDDDQTGASGSLNPKDSFWFNKQTKIRSNWRSGDIDQMKKALSGGSR